MTNTNKAILALLGALFALFALVMIRDASCIQVLSYWGCILFKKEAVLMASGSEVLVLSLDSINIIGITISVLVWVAIYSLIPPERILGDENLEDGAEEANEDEGDVSPIASSLTIRKVIMLIAALIALGLLVQQAIYLWNRF